MTKPLSNPIREEIEKLRMAKPHYIDWGGEVEYAVRNSTVDAVQAIVDRWEVVMDYDAPVDISLHALGKCDNYADVGFSFDFQEGDRIIILREKRSGR